MKTWSSQHLTVCRRRGALFHYYMVYLSLTSMLLVTTGLCFHAIIEADRRDLNESRFLYSLLSAEKQLRQDSSVATSVMVSGNSLQLNTDAELIRWGIDVEHLNRFNDHSDTSVVQQAIRFPQGSQLQWKQREDGAVLLTVVEPSMMQPRTTARSKATRENPDGQDSHVIAETAAPGNDSTARQIELLLWIPPEQGAGGSQADTAEVDLESTASPVSDAQTENPPDNGAGKSP
ncbi:MAG: hypothetical protein Fues2KO_05270 [Fuerstiella sp.]